MLYEAVVNLIGVPPVGYEPLIYVLCIPVFLWLLSTVFSIFFTLVNWMEGRR